MHIGPTIAPPARRPRHALRAWPALLALLLALCSCGASSAPSATTAPGSQDGFEGAPMPPGGAPHDFTLTDQDGQRVSLASYRGRVVILSFLYPACGATCVLVAQQIRGALDELARPVPVLIVSAEPAADTPASMRRFLKEVSLSGRALYLTGTRVQLAPIWRAYHVEPASAGRTAFTNYVGAILIDRAGSERVLFEQEELTPEGLAHDVLKLERE